MSRQIWSAVVYLIAKIIEFFPLERLGKIFETLARKTEKYRKQHKGLVPREIFYSSLKITGHYFCFEIFVQSNESGGVYLWKRRKNETGWQGLYHIPGVAFRGEQDDLGKVLARLSLEIFGAGDAIKWEDLRHVGLEIHDEPERTVCPTMVFAIDLPASCEKELAGEWKYFAEDAITDEEGIINFHRNTLKWVFDPNRQPVVDLR